MTMLRSFLLTLLLLPALAFGQARVQVIHNAADPAAALVDIYLVDSGGNEIKLDDVAFRAATAFLDVPAETYTIYVAGSSSTGIGDALASFPGVTLADGARYVVVANGVLDPNTFAANPDGRSTAFNLWIKDMAREAADDPTSVEFFAVHGATDAPAVDVVARGVGTLVDGNAFAYGDLTGYLAVPPAAYTLEVTLPGGTPTVVAYEANLNGLGGGTAAIVASGFLDPAANQNGAGFALLAVLADGTVLTLPAAPLGGTLDGRNEVEPVETLASGSFDVTLDGSALTITGTFDDLSSAYAASHIHIGATGENGGVALTLTPTLDADNLGGSFNQTFDLSADLDPAVITQADFVAALFNGGLYVNIHTANNPGGELRGQILLQPNDVPPPAEITFPPDGTALTIEGDPATPFEPAWSAVEDPEGDDVSYIWQLSASPIFDALLVNDNVGNATVFATDFATVDALLEGAGVAVGQTVTLYHRVVVTDGSVPVEGTATSVVLTRGEVAPTPIGTARTLPEGTRVTVQGIVTTPDYGFSSGNFFLQDESGGINVFDPNNGGNSDGITPYAAGQEVRIVGTTGTFNDQVQIEVESFEILSEGNPLPEPVEIDLSAFTVDSPLQGSRVTISGVRLVDPAQWPVEKINTSSGVSVDVVDVAGQTAVVRIDRDESFFDASPAPEGYFALTGVLGRFQDTPQLFPFFEDELVEGVVIQVIHGAPAFGAVDVYANGGLLIDDLDFKSAIPYTFTPEGTYTLAIAPGTSNETGGGGAGDAVATFPDVPLMNPNAYQVIALNETEGDTDDNAVDVLLLDDARVEAQDAGLVALRVVHGSPDAPPVDVLNVDYQTNGVLFADLAFQEASGYGEVPPAVYRLGITPTGAGFGGAVAVYEADLSGAAGAALTVLATGLLSPGAGEPPFEVIAIDKLGNIIMPGVVTATDEGTDLPERFAVRGNYPNPFSQSTQIVFDLPRRADVQLEVYDVLGRRVRQVEARGMAPGAGHTLTVEANGLPAGLYLYRLTIRTADQEQNQVGRMMILR
ncbi:MAG: hypothetical protein KatS3mg042_0898 [Rhodothermaceae bacterium]|nr:MAG: hypothetical protein KatS3mg042_0898 [Rhodothermaceae bacterium]